jgi:hypothetical protein
MNKSEILLFLLFRLFLNVAPTEAAPHPKLLIMRVLYFQSALCGPLTLSHLIVFSIRGQFALICKVVARFAEVGGSPAEPGRHRATEAALKLYEISPMGLAIGHPHPNRLRGAFATNQVFLLELCLLLGFLFVLFISAILSGPVSTCHPPSEVRLLALETHVVS